MTSSSLRSDLTASAICLSSFLGNTLTYFQGRVFLAGVFLSMFPSGRAIVRTIGILPALVTASETAPLVWNGEPVHHTQMTAHSQTGTVYLDIYSPTTSVPIIHSIRGGILIIPGAGDNRTVPQLINLSESMARTGLVVMDMTTPTFMNYSLSVQDEDAVVQ